MADEIVKILKVETGDSQQTVKSLREEIKDLRDNILNLEEGTSAYDKAVDKLQSDQRKLDEVMSLTKKTATALDGSYDALTQKMSLLKKEWRATNDEAKRNELGKQIADINDQLKEMDASVGNFQRNVGNYTESIIDAFEQMNHSVDEWKNKAADAWEKGDIEEYTKAIQEAGKAQAKVERIESDLEASTPSLEKQFQGLTDTASGLASGFELVQSIMILAGKDTEDFEKTMIKVQATMAMVQSIQGIAGLAKGFKMLGTTIRSLGNTIVATSKKITTKGGIIGVILAASAALAGYLIKLNQAKREADEYARYISSAAYAQEQLNTATERANEKISHQTELMKLQGKSQKDILEFQKSQLQKQINRQQEVVDKAKEQYDDIHEKRFLGIGYGKWNKKYTEEDENEAWNVYEDTRDAMKELSSQMEIINAGLDEIDRQAKEEAANIRKNAEDYFKSEEQLLYEHYQEDLKTLQEAGEDTKALTNKYYAELAEIRKKNHKDGNSGLPDVNTIVDGLVNDIKIEDDTDFTGDDKVKLGETSNGAVDTAGYKIIAKERAYRKEQNDLILLDEEERQKKEYEMLRNFQDQKLAILQEAEGKETDLVKKTQVQQEIADLEIDIERTKNEELKRLDDEAAAHRQETATNAINTVQASASAISSILSGLASVYQQDLDNQLAAGKISEEAYDQKFKKIKAIQIAEATINTIAGAVGAFMGITKDTGGWGIAIAAIQAAAVATTGAMQIAQIAKTEPGAANVQRGMVQPPTNIFNDEEPQPTRNITGYKETEELNKAQKVYILESDLQESAKRVQVRESETSF